MKKAENIAIFGAGLVGSLLAIFLKKRGYAVTLYERRGDMRTEGIAGGRSINLAISERGWKALSLIGMEAEIRDMAIPMHGRMIHALNGELQFQPYGLPGQFISSVSRGALNIALMNRAEREGVPIRFGQRLLETNLEGTAACLENAENPSGQWITPDLLIGADGAFSMMRYTMLKTERFNYAQEYEEHSYKELSIPAGNDGTWQLEKHALHIWPRKSFMLIALPNLDGSFTCTLFHHTHGNNSISSMHDAPELNAFFQTWFPDALALMPTLEQDFFENPTGSLVTVKCYPWAHGNSFLIGDAAHAIIPFYGQGMNCGFEDCSVLDALMEAHNGDWHGIMAEYQAQRKPDTDAIADLARLNFIEMRDLVADPKFQLGKKIAAKVSERYPDHFLPVYSMVSFSDIPYREALQEYKRQESAMSEILGMPEVEAKWDHEYFDRIAAMLNKK